MSSHLLLWLQSTSVSTFKSFTSCPPVSHHCDYLPHPNVIDMCWIVSSFSEFVVPVFPTFYISSFCSFVTLLASFLSELFRLPSVVGPPSDLNASVIRLSSVYRIVFFVVVVKGLQSVITFSNLYEHTPFFLTEWRSGIVCCYVLLSVSMFFHKGCVWKCLCCNVVCVLDFEQYKQTDN